MPLITGHPGEFLVMMFLVLPLLVALWLVLGAFVLSIPFWDHMERNKASYLLLHKALGLGLWPITFFYWYYKGYKDENRHSRF